MKNSKKNKFFLDYTPAAPSHDIAVLKLTKKIKYDYNNAEGSSTISKVTLTGYNDKIPNGASALVSGWGTNPVIKLFKHIIVYK